MHEIVYHVLFGPLALLVGALAALPEIARFRRWMRHLEGKLPVRNQWGLRVGRYRAWAQSTELYWVQLVLLAIALVLSIVSYLLAPKPKAPKPDSNKDLQDPVAEAGMPIPVIAGTLTLKGLNALWYGDKRKLRYKVKPPS